MLPAGPRSAFRSTPSERGRQALWVITCQPAAARRPTGRRCGILPAAARRLPKGGFGGASPRGAGAVPARGSGGGSPRWAGKYLGAAVVGARRRQAAGANHGREGCGETSPPTLPAGPRSVFPTVGGRERGRPQTAGSSAVFSRDHRRGCGRQWRRPATDREPIGSAAAFPPPATLRAGGRAPPGRAGTLNTNGAGERERGDRPARRAIQGGRGGIPPQQPGRARTDGQARRNPSEWRGTAAVPLRRGERHDT